jgi:hypothetical protein
MASPRQHARNDHHPNPGRRIGPRLLVATLIAVALTGAPSPLHADGESASLPAVPGNLQVPTGHVAYLTARAVGTQNYVCLRRTTGKGRAWSFLGPQATLFDGQGEQIATHFLSANPLEGGTARATWQHSDDTSAAWAMAIASSADPAYVAPNAIPWLLLRAVGAQDGPTAGDALSATAYIQRVDTVGGTAPPRSCPALGARLMVPYEADYVFYRAE